MRDYAPSSESALRILTTSDLHMNVAASLDPGAQEDMPGGLARLSTLIAARVKDAPDHCIILDNGDFLQGTRVSDHLATQAGHGAPHPLAQAFNAIGYSAIGLGNHDFDYGLPVLSKVANQFTAPLLSANFEPTHPADWVKRSTLISVGPIRVGITSALPIGTALWSHTHLSGQAEIVDMLDALRTESKRLKDAGADIVVILAHSGFALVHSDRDNLLGQISQANICDILVGGHTHVVFPDVGSPQVDKTPSVIPGYGGSWLGEFDICLHRDADEKWIISSADAHLIPVTRAIPEDPDILTLFETPARKAHQTFATPVGKTPVPLTSYFATIAPNASMSYVARAQMKSLDEMRRGTGLADLPILSAVSPAKSGGIYGPAHFTDIPAGDIRLGDLYDLQEFANELWAIVVTGAELQDWLEHAVGHFNRLGKDRTPLINDTSPAFNFDVMFGLTYDIDLTQPARFCVNGVLQDERNTRVHNLRHESRPVHPSQTFLVAASSFRLCGGGNFPGLSADRAVLKSARTVRDALSAQCSAEMFAPPDQVFRFSSASPMQTIYRTGPKALHHIEDIAHLNPSPSVARPDGFIDIPLTI